MGDVAHSVLRSLHRPLPASRGRARRQPAQRGGALAASAGEPGEAEAGGAVREGGFFNRAAELHSLTERLANKPTAVLVLTGPPSCGKTGAHALRCLGLCSVVC